jgi:hypothetical protein
MMISDFLRDHHPYIKGKKLFQEKIQYIVFLFSNYHYLLFIA